METLYIDKDIIVCEKEYGVASQAGHSPNMLEIIKREHGVSAFVVHRLDIKTSGLMVYALNDSSASSLSSQISNGLFEKEYLAIVHGQTPTSVDMCDLLYHDKTTNKSFVVDTRRKGAKEARLSLTTLSTVTHEGKVLSLVKIRLYTGRTHQIRVQLSSRNFPLYGDGKYGARDNDKIALYSHTLAFSHPKTGKKMSFGALPCVDGAWALFADVLNGIMPI